jgi:hypothetical protein
VQHGLRSLPQLGVRENHLVELERQSSFSNELPTAIS